MWSRPAVINGLILMLMLVSAVQAAEQVIEVLPMATRHPDGPEVIAEETLAVGFACLTIRLNRVQMANPSAQIAFLVRLSFDGGATWYDPDTGNPLSQSRVVAPGGAALVGGSPAPWSSTSITLRQPENANRRVLVQYEVLGSAERFGLQAVLRDTPCG